MNGLYSGLPWGWFLGIAGFDAVLGGVVIHRRRNRREGPVVELVGRAGQVRVNGWWVPETRASAITARAPSAWQWPVHREYLRRSVYSARVYGGGAVVS